MVTRKISRRHFVKGLASASAGIAALGSGSHLLANNYSRILGANDRIRVGVIGCGGMANAHMEALMKMANGDNVEITAVCDVYTNRLDQAKELTKGQAIKDYRQLLESFLNST